MNGLVCFEPDVLRDTDGADVAKKRHSSASAGIFALRRAHYFNKAGGFNGTGKPSNLTPDENPEAARQALAYNLRTVVNIAKRATNRDAALFDLVREQNPGLIHALEQGEVEGRFCFSAYATQCIRRYIERGIAGQSVGTSSGVAANISC
ncbi:MAG: hypothetical protein PHP70_00095 [Gallionella sp.]|nr:hypothetical protein [Gallionella sp.]